ncbi:L-rhamnose mutarotase [Paenibacillus sp. 2TAB26]|uniref:L-rhamnose mutarotase n=1 Tax=Paenibacillus sp. 2TAB26 TaxID=3233005 RepID=UPI003F9A23E0
MKRYGWIIKVKMDRLAEYKALHTAVWPEVLNRLKESNVQNYSIYYQDGNLFSYLEYTGQDFEKDMANMAADPITQAWWKLTDPCQEPVDSASEGEWWTTMEEVFHMD